jgi:hypothetical protein
LTPGTVDLRWIEEPKMLEIVDLPRSTFQGWASAGLVDRDGGGAYPLAVTLELVLLGALRETLSVEELKVRWPKLRRSGLVEDFVRRAHTLAAAAAAAAEDADAAPDRFDLVLEIKHGGVSIATDDVELATAVRNSGAPRPVIVLDLVPRLRNALDGFEAWSIVGRRPMTRKVGRPAARGNAQVRELRA